MSILKFYYFRGQSVHTLFYKMLFSISFSPVELRLPLSKTSVCSCQTALCFSTLISSLIPLLLFSIPLSTHSWCLHNPHHKKPTNQTTSPSNPELHRWLFWEVPEVDKRKKEGNCGPLCCLWQWWWWVYVCFKHVVHFHITSSKIPPLSPRSHFGIVSYPLQIHQSVSFGAFVLQICFQYTV